MVYDLMNNDSRSKEIPTTLITTCIKYTYDIMISSITELINILIYFYRKLYFLSLID